MKEKPIIFVQGRYKYNSESLIQQQLLIRAMTITQNPKKLAQMVGVKGVAEVTRLWDKIERNKRFQKDLLEAGIDFPWLIKKIKNEIETAEKSSDRLNGLNMLLKSSGVDKYEETEESVGSWEEALIQLSDEKEANNEKLKLAEYTVAEPVMPEHIRLAKEKANKESKGLYE